MKPNSDRWSREALDRRLLQATSIQFETDEEIDSAVEAIMTGRFNGRLVHRDVKLHSFRPPSIFGTKLHDGRRVGRFDQSDLRVARRFMGGYHYDGGFDAVDRTSLKQMFQSGGFVENGAGQRAFEACVKSFWQQIRQEKLDEVARIKKEALGQADDERKAALVLGFERLKNRSPDSLLHAVVTLASHSTASLLEAVSSVSDTQGYSESSASDSVSFTDGGMDFSSSSM